MDLTSVTLQLKWEFCWLETSALQEEDDSDGAHSAKVGGSNPPCATKKSTGQRRSEAPALLLRSRNVRTSRRWAPGCRGPVCL